MRLEDEEDRTLINGSKPTGLSSTRKLTYFVVLPVALIGSLTLLIAAALGAFVVDSDPVIVPEAPRLNIVFMLSDGYGPASATLARDYVDPAVPLPLEHMLVGTSVTYSTSQLVTDSAAGATCFSCGMKTYNGAIGVDPDRAPCPTVLEAAKHSGYATGLVVTSTVTHASPAAFAAHVVDRNMEALIAEHELSQDLDVVFGGGRCFWQPSTAPGSCRDDDKDLMEKSREKGVRVITTKEEFEANDYHMPVLGLFSQSHMRYEIDRRATQDQPTLTDMTKRALGLLEADGRPFFLFVEGSRIDHASHANDVAAHVHDILEYQDTVVAVREFAERNGNTLVVSVSDHETGGLTVGRDGVYNFYPDVVRAVQHSGVFVAEKLIADPGLDAEEVVAEDMGVTDLSAGELDRINTARAGGSTNDLSSALVAPVSLRALVGWTTGGHTGVDVGLHAFGPDHAVDRFRGVHQNHEVGLLVADILSLDVPALAESIRQRFGNNTGGLHVRSDGIHDSGH